MSTRSLVSPNVSRRFDVLRTVLVVFVIGIHAEKGILAYFVEPLPAALRVYLALFPHNIFRLCVPIFFSISGYLFALTFKPGAAAYGRMLRKKSRTILIPYLLFNAITLGLMFLFHKVPYMGDLNFIRQHGFWKLLLGVYDFPAVYPLWFLRDLYVYFLLAPVFSAMAAELPLLGLVVFWAMWMFVPQAGVPVELSGAFFFYPGCLLSSRKVDLEAADRFVGPATAVGVAMVFFLGCVEYFHVFSGYYHLIYRNTMIAGTIAVWCLSASAWLRENRLLLGLSGISFFVYLTHEPILSYLIYATRFVWKPAGSLAGIVYMLLLLVAAFALAACLGRLLQRFLPRGYAVATGSR